MPVVASTGIDLSEFRLVAATSLLAFAAVAWLLVSVGPALAIVRCISPALVTTGTRTMARGSRATSSLLLVQTALAVCLVAMASSAYRMFAALSRAAMGFATEGVTALDLSVPDWKYSEPPARADLERRLVTRLRSLPGVTAAAGVSVRPFRFGAIADGILVRRPEDAGTAREPTGASRVIVSPAFFEAMGIAIEQARR